MDTVGIHSLDSRTAWNPLTEVHDINTLIAILKYVPKWIEKRKKCGSPLIKDAVLICMIDSSENCNQPINQLRL